MPFPQYQKKYKESALFSPLDFLRYKKKQGSYPKHKSPEGVIFCYDKTIFDLIKTREGKSIEGFYGTFYLLTGTEEKVGVMGNFGIGAPVVVALMEDLIAYGVKRFISIGVAGSLQKKLTVGSIVVCDRAIRDEGTSHHYLKPSKYVYASKTMMKQLTEELTRLGLDHVVGTSWTCDAPYRETLVEIQQYREEGVLTVEMEASAIFSVAQYRRVEAGAMFTISDYLADFEWKPKFHLTLEHLEKLFQAATNVLYNLK